MITRLKQRPRSDTLPVETRTQRRSWDRAIYLTLLAVFGAAMLDYAFGDRVMLRADGLVLRDRSVIAATSLVRVSELRVRPGQAVSAGQVLLRADSTAMLDRFADLALRRAALDERLAGLVSEAALTEALLPVARDRLAALDADLDRLAASEAGGLVTAARREGVGDRRHDARAELSRLDARRAGLAQEIAAVQSAAAQADAAIARLSEHYGDGLRRAPRAGIVGPDVPSEGQVFRPGEPILAILSGGQYVLAYLPRHYLFRIEPGQPVRLSDGTARARGHVEAILPVSDSIPDEFHNSFRARERRQLARIALPADSPFPTRATVRIRSDLALRERLSAFASRIRALRPGPAPAPA